MHQKPPAENKNGHRMSLGFEKVEKQALQPNIHRSTTAPLNPETPLQGALSGTNDQGQPCEHWVQRYAWDNKFNL